jgi:hypothetical protein
MTFNDIVRISVAVLIFICPKVGTSQTVSVNRNLVYIDSIEGSIKAYMCGGDLIYPSKYDAKSIENDLSIVQMLNVDFDTNISVPQFYDELDKIKCYRVYRNDTRNGLITAVKVKISGTYLQVELTFEYIDNYFIRKKIILKTISSGKCVLISWRFPDFNVLRHVFLKKINFPIKYSDNQYIIANMLIEENIKIASNHYKTYKFLTSATEKWVNNLLLNQYNTDSSCCYCYTKANSDFTNLIINDKVDLIKDLLYSPNYFYSINAMEALLYLATVHKVEITEGIRQKMDSLCADTSIITVRESEDMFSTVEGYRALKTSNSQIIQNYMKSLKP